MLTLIISAIVSVISILSVFATLIYRVARMESKVEHQDTEIMKLEKKVEEQGQCLTELAQTLTQKLNEFSANLTEKIGDVSATLREMKAELRGREQTGKHNTIP